MLVGIMSLLDSVSLMGEVLHTSGYLQVADSMAPVMIFTQSYTVLVILVTLNKFVLHILWEMITFVPVLWQWIIAEWDKSILPSENAL